MSKGQKLWKRAKEINILLKQIEIGCERYKLKLNKAKCHHVDMNHNNRADVKFKDGTPVERVDKEKYLGGMITQNTLRSTDLNNRLGIAFGTIQKLKTFWKNTNASITIKMSIKNLKKV